MKITALSTGVLELKPTFLEGSPAHGGPVGLIRALGRDPRWTAPLPMWSWIIETGTERILVDAGARPGARGGPTRTRFHISSDQALVPELARRGLTPGDFDRVLLTHLHGDHVGGLAAFDQRRVWVARSEWAPVARFPGRLLRFLTAPVPRGFVPSLFDFDGPALLGFPGSWRVTPDGSIVALPTPGHSPGHTSFLLRSTEGDVLLAGDVTYDLPALHNQREQGFIANVEEHRQTLSRVLSLVRRGIAYLPSHDPESPARLAGRNPPSIYHAHG
ncbi:MAG TPA: N-acyl homoserine lactonase family protein [Gemmatimonadales bacterium]|jgi:glyoxylase-like metal-dependent hydrolase (beta-lactamase superfamily II)|nr:N-acyl homoserine lactonase family protein [Gemmatimonadales bacterium]